MTPPHAICATGMLIPAFASGGIASGCDRSAAAFVDVFACGHPAGITRVLISPPRSRSATARSCWVCRFIQNCAELPK
jgi:hypothetical protein